jgi:hypothetical protein
MKQADKTFAGLSALKNAQEEGLNFGKLRNGEEVKRFISGLSDGEKETYKIGVKDYLMDKAMKTGDANSSARKIFSQPLEKEKLKAVFNNPKQFEDFAKRMNDEIRVFDTKQRLVGGSRTDFNIQEGAELLDKVAKGAIKFIAVLVENENPPPTSVNGAKDAVDMNTGLLEAANCICGEEIVAPYLEYVNEE